MSWKDDLIKKLGVARGKKVSPETIEGILELFEEIGESRSRKIIREICLADNLPSNLYGAIEKQYNYFKQIENEYQDRAYNNRDYSEADKYPADINTLWKFIEEHMLWHSLGLITECYLSTPMDIDTWINKGRPMMCCKLHHTWMQGYENSYKQELNDPESDAIAKFTKAFTNKLIKTRLERAVL